ncbi:MAG: serine/threonine protein kinase [Candidatus Melainabacteria bacterium]|nr:serine/threonine protein kinase [Candidatus Melainabacteria bacterium]
MVGSKKNALVEVDHLVDYDHYVDSTPVGSFLGVMSGALDQSGVATVLLGTCMLGFLVFLFQKLFISAFVVIIAAMGLIMIGSAIVSRRNPIKADQEGLRLPFIQLLSANFQLDRPWSELKEVRFLKDDILNATPNRLAFIFRDGAIVPFNLDGFSRASLKKLFLIINTYRPDVPIKPSLAELNLGLAQIASSDRAPGFLDPGTVSALSFTEFWQNELRGRFGSTAFVPLACGDTLQDDRFEIVGQVGFGGLSAIYLARQADESIVVLKEFLLPDSVDDAAREKAVSMFEREAQLLSRIDHENIASVNDYFVEEGRHYIVLQHVEGKNLRSYVQEYGPQNETTLLRWARELGEIVAYLHGLEPPVIHRDLTPDNIIVGSDGRLTLIDFGAANNFIGTATGTVVGKSAYIPLEQFQGKARPASDIYALGATLFFLAVGRDPEPFSMSDALERGARISRHLNNLIRSSTAVKVEKRIQTASQWLAIVDDLSEIGP